MIDGKARITLPNLAQIIVEKNNDWLMTLNPKKREDFRCRKFQSSSDKSSTNEKINAHHYLKFDIRELNKENFCSYLFAFEIGLDFPVKFKSWLKRSWREILLITQKIVWLASFLYEGRKYQVECLMIFPWKSYRTLLIAFHTWNYFPTSSLLRQLYAYHRKYTYDVHCIHIYSDTDTEWLHK